MKARRSIANHTSSFKYCSPLVTSKRFSVRGSDREDQENIAPATEDASFSAAKRRKLFNGNAVPVTEKPPQQPLDTPASNHTGSAMDMEMSSTLTPKRLGPSTSCMFTPPSRISSVNGAFGGTFSTPRASNVRQKTIQEVFRNVVVYVEVKTIDEDRSDMIKAVAQQMGATVNDKLYKNTTHVVFREGSMTTYKKALKMNIPLVSVTWLEECRKTLSLVDPARFLPINLEPYEHPELYKRVRKAIPSNGDVNLTPERFALKPLKPEEELEKALLEYQQTKLRFELDSPTQSQSQLGRTALNFSPIGESTKIGSQVTKTPNQSSVTPLLRRLMIRNAEEDRRERDNFLLGRSGAKPLPVLETTKYDRLSMDLASLWGPDDAQNETNNATESMVEATVDLTATSPSNPPVASVKPVESKTSSIMRALRRQTMHFTQNATLDISPQAVKENVAAFVNKSLTADPDVSNTVHDDSVEVVESDSFSKVPKICAVQRKSLDEDTLRDDIVKAKEELLSKAVIINKSDKRRSLMPGAMNAPVPEKSVFGGQDAASQANKVNRRRTLFNVNAITEGGLISDAKNKEPKAAAKRKTMMPSQTSQSSMSSSSNSPSPVEKKKTKAAEATNGTVKSRRSLLPANNSQIARKGSNMGPPAAPSSSTAAKAAPTKASLPGAAKKSAAEEGPIKRKLFNSIAENSPVSSPVQSPVKSKIKLMGKPTAAETKVNGKERPSERTIKFSEPQPPPPVVAKTAAPKRTRRSTMDFQPAVSSSSNSSVGSTSASSVASVASSRGTMGYGGGAVRGQRSVIVLTNGKEKHMEYIKELIGRLGGDFEIDNRVTSKTTHLICCEKKRNMNMLRGLIRGIWVLDYSWALKSDVLGAWQREEMFQVDTFGSTLTRVRSERQAFGPGYKMELFSGTAKYFVYETTTVPTIHLKELITSCGGIVVDTPVEAKYHIADKARPEVQVISPSWIFECICQYTFLNHRKYYKK